MRLQTVSSIFIVLALLSGFSDARAQISCENPLEYAALTEGNIAINTQIESQIAGQTSTAALENIISEEFRKIHEWEEKYSKYTQTVSGYASSLNAATHIYDDALKILLSLGGIRHAVNDNPQGIVATMSVNALYMETAAELVSCFTLLRDAVAKGGVQNMLTGAERSQLMWSINDKLESLARKLQKLALCVRYYTMMDVWHTYSAGVIERDYTNVAGLAHDRWRRAARAIVDH